MTTSLRFLAMAIMASISKLPAEVTGMIACVRGVMAASTAFGSRVERVQVNVRENRDRIGSMTAEAVEKKVYGGR